MANDITKKPEDELHNRDGFDCFTDEAEGGDQDQDQFIGGRVIQGGRINFSNEAVWIDAAKQPLPANLELIVVNIGRNVTKWGKDNMPIETIVLAPNEKFPALKAKNEACPKSEWRERFGKLEGPWQAQHVVYMLDPTTMNKYSWPASTTGGHICVRDLVEKTQLMRKFRGQRVYAVVKFSKTLMSKKYNRQRPDLIVLRWITLDGTNPLPTANTPSLTGPTTPPADSPSTPADSTPTPAAAKPASAKEAVDHLGMQTVTPPTAKEVTGDEIPF
jgi:hypothetical protein